MLEIKVSLDEAGTQYAPKDSSFLIPLALLSTVDSDAPVVISRTAPKASTRRIKTFSWVWLVAFHAPDSREAKAPALQASDVGKGYQRLPCQLCWPKVIQVTRESFSHDPGMRTPWRH